MCGASDRAICQQARRATDELLLKNNNAPFSLCKIGRLLADWSGGHLLDDKKGPNVSESVELRNYVHRFPAPRRNIGHGNLSTSSRGKPIQKEGRREGLWSFPPRVKHAADYRRMKHMLYPVI